MKQLFLSLSLSFLASDIFGQINFDSLDNAIHKDYYTQLDSIFKLSKNNNLEFRLWTTSSLTFHRASFIMTQNNNVWHARYFERENNGTDIYWIEKKVNQSNLDSLWSRLKTNCVLTLPTQNSLKQRLRIYTADTTLLNNDDEDYSEVRVMDGTRYRFEIISKEINRVYNYHSPASYLEHNPNIEELYRAYKIISLTRRYLGLPLY